MTGVEIALAAGAVASAAGAGLAAQAQANQADYASKVAKQQARSTQQQANIDASQYLKDQRRLQATARARRAASGVVPTLGSALLVDEDMTSEIAFNAERIRRGGALVSSRLREQAGLDRLGAQSTRIGGGLLAGSTLLTMSDQVNWGNGSAVPTTPAYRTGRGGRLAGPV